MAKRWSIEEESLLLTEYARLQDVEKLICIFPDRSLSSIKTKLYKLGISRDRSWTDTEINTLILLRNEGKSASYISCKINRTQGSVEKKIQELLKDNIISRTRNQAASIEWSIEEVDFIIYSYTNGYTIDDLAICLSRTPDSVRRKIERLKNYGINLRKNTSYSRQPWTEQEEQILIELNSKEIPYYKIANILNRSLGSIYAKSDKLKKSGIPLINMSHSINRGMPVDKTTLVYLVYFYEEDFYKIGITQRDSVNKRFYGIDKESFEIIDTIECKDLIEALSIEHRVLVKMHSYSFKPDILKHRGGSTECFKLLNKPFSIQKLLDY